MNNKEKQQLIKILKWFTPIRLIRFLMLAAFAILIYIFGWGFLVGLILGMMWVLWMYFTENSALSNLKFYVDLISIKLGGKDEKQE